MNAQIFRRMHAPAWSSTFMNRVARAFTVQSKLKCSESRIVQLHLSLLCTINARALYRANLFLASRECALVIPREATDVGKVE